MSKNTKIEWCDHTWSPWRGCTKVSPGCANCYAETLSRRNPRVLGQWGKGKPRVLAKNWNDPVRWNKCAAQKSCGYCLFEESDGELLKQCHRCAQRPRVFPSLCDWLDEEVDIHWLARFLALIQSTPNLEWQLLTKRPEIWRERLVGAYSHMQSFGGGATPQLLMVINWLDGEAPKNVRIGTSVEDQPRADERIPALLQIPAAKRFLSVEPMLGPVDMKLDQIEVEASFRHADDCKGFCDYACGGEEVKGGIDWVIVGGESGPGARPCNVEWIRSIVAQCAAAGVPCFVKQLGARPVEYSDVAGANCAFSNHGRPIAHPKGGDPEEWPEDLRVRQFPEVKL